MRRNQRPPRAHKRYGPRRRKRRWARGGRALLAALPGSRAHLTLAAVAVLSLILSINTLVRLLGGGNPNPLSPLHLVDKSRALSDLLRHELVHVFDDEHPDPRAVVRAAARRNGVPVGLALSVARTESSLHPHAISHTGAMGLMQLMPNTAEQFGVSDAFDSAQNADGATRYLHSLLSRYHGNARRALAAYNAGPGRVPAHGGATLPPETQHYLHTVLSAQAMEAHVPAW